MNMNKHIWEGWTVQDFVNYLEPIFKIIQGGQSWQKPFVKNSKELKEWIRENQPYYKKHIPEVYRYFNNQINQ